MNRDPLIVAIDGPSGVGKSTTSKLVARALNMPHIDTGAMYRAIGLAALDACRDAANRWLFPELGDPWQEIRAAYIAGMDPATHYVDVAGTLALGVPDVADAKAALEAAGVQVNDMWDSGVCHGAGFRDPAGNPILLHHRYAPYGPR